MCYGLCVALAVDLSLHKDSYLTKIVQGLGGAIGINVLLIAYDMPSHARMRVIEEKSYSDDQVLPKHKSSLAHKDTQSEHNTLVITRAKTKSTSKEPHSPPRRGDQKHRGVSRPISLNEVKPKVAAVIYFLQALQAVVSKFNASSVLDQLSLL